MLYLLLARGIFSFASGLTIAVVGFGCDSLRELFDRLSAEPGAYPASSAINMGLSVALVTGVQAIWQRRQVNGALLLSILPLTFIGVLLSLNVFSASVLSALVPALGACLFGLCLAKLWMELADCRKRSSSREPDDERRHGVSTWRWTGILGTASLAGGLLSGWCPPPGPAFMVVLLGLGGTAKMGGGEWRATAAFVTCCSSFLRVGLLLLENGAYVHPLFEVLILVVGGLAGVVAGNVSLLLCSPRETNSDSDQGYDRPPAPATFRRLVLIVSLVSSVAMATGGPPAELSLVARPVALAALVLVCAVAVFGAIWGCMVGSRGWRDARGAYAMASADERDVEMQLKPLAAVNGQSDPREGDDDDGDGRGDDEYLDEEDGYLADEGETEQMIRSGRHNSRSKRVRELRGGGARRVAYSVTSKGRSTADVEGGTEGNFVGDGQARQRPEEGGQTLEGAAPDGSPRFPAGHTSEL